MKGLVMGIGDKIKNEAQDIEGKVQEGLGKLTGNERLEVKGEANQFEADVKKGIEDAKDDVKHARDEVRDAIDERV